MKWILKNWDTASQRHPWELARVNVVIDFIRKAIGKHDESQISVVDIGCGDLFVLDTISTVFKFDEFFGVDIAFSNDDVEKLNVDYRGTNIKVFNNLDNLSVKPNNISIVLLNDVVEHIENDKGFIVDLQKNKNIDNQTVFIITVPAFQSLFCSHDLFIEHYRRYNNSQLIQLLKSSNYSINDSGYFFFVLLLPRLLNVIKEKLLFKNQQKAINGIDLTNWKGREMTSSIIKNMLLFDYYLLRFFLKIKIKIPGLSTYVICRKNG